MNRYVWFQKRRLNIKFALVCTAAFWILPSPHASAQTQVKFVFEEDISITTASNSTVVNIKAGEECFVAGNHFRGNVGFIRNQFYIPLENKNAKHAEGHYKLVPAKNFSNQGRVVVLRDDAQVFTKVATSQVTTI